MRVLHGNNTQNLLQMRLPAKESGSCPASYAINPSAYKTASKDAEIATIVLLLGLDKTKLTAPLKPMSTKSISMNLGGLMT